MRRMRSPTLPILVPPPVTAEGLAAHDQLVRDASAAGASAAESKAVERTPSTSTKTSARSALPSVASPAARRAGAGLGKTTGGALRRKQKMKRKGRPQRPAARFNHLDIAAAHDAAAGVGAASAASKATSPSGFSMYRPEELEAARRSERRLAEKLRSKVEGAWADLPMDFVSEQRTKAYCQMRGVESLERIYEQLLHAKERQAFDALVRCMEHHRQRERAAEMIEYRQGRGLTLLKATVAKMKRRHAAKGFKRWLRAVKKMRAAARRRAALVIQNFSRRVKACKFILVLKRDRVARTSNNDGLMLACAFFEFRSRRGAAETQIATSKALWEYRAHMYEVAAASKLQAVYRGVVGRVESDKIRIVVEEYRRLLQKCARKLQSAYRMRQGKMVAESIREVHRAVLREQAGAATRLQSKFRGRKEMRNVGVLKQQYYDAACKLQGFWRKRMGDWEMHLRFVARRAALKEEREIEKKRVAALRLAAAMLLQRGARKLSAKRRGERRRRQIAALAQAKLNEAARRRGAIVYLQNAWRVYWERCASECSFIYRYIPRESCSQFDSLPLTSLTIALDRRQALCHEAARNGEPRRQGARSREEVAGQVRHDL